MPTQEHIEAVECNNGMMELLITLKLGLEQLD
jgi:hypothetical protein